MSMTAKFQNTGKRETAGGGSGQTERNPKKLLEGEGWGNRSPAKDSELKQILPKSHWMHKYNGITPLKIFNIF